MGSGALRAAQSQAMSPGQAPATGITSGHLLLGVSMVRAPQAGG